ncbi:uncharacterized protein VTP21DRAFT_5036 [Calcarisporiella thermophila]|uniref:uncharacterized protein n=1 Tax=Calcarisporiella thermophila TaxID=911321 RepID=UPI003742BE8C
MENQRRAGWHGDHVLGILALARIVGGVRSPKDISPWRPPPISGNLSRALLARFIWLERITFRVQRVCLLDLAHVLGIPTSSSLLPRKLMKASRIVLLALFANVARAVPMAKRMQPEAPKLTIPLEFRPLEWGDFSIIQTTDTHGFLPGHLTEANYAGDWGDFTSFVEHMKEKSRELKKDLFVIDTGDLHDGNGFADASEVSGTQSDPLFFNIPYDALTIGNHELYDPLIAEQVFKNFAPKWEGRYLTSNVHFKNPETNETTPIGSQFLQYKGEFGTKALVFGFLFNFKSFANNTVVLSVEETVKQPWFTQALQEANDTNLIIINGHIPIRGPEFGIIHKAIRAVHPTKPIVMLAGHSHVRDFAFYDAHAVALQSGRYMETVGWLSINGLNETDMAKNLTVKRLYLDNNRPTYIHYTNTTEETFDTKNGKQITEDILRIRNKLNTTFVLGCVPQDYYLTRVPVDDANSLYKMLSTELLPKTIVNASRPNPPLAVLSTGSQRFDLFKGKFTNNELYTTSPFKNKWRYVPDVDGAVGPNLLAKLNAVQAFHKRGEADNLGYVTKDDLNGEGDAVKHTPVPFIKLPNYIASPAPTAQKIDVVYPDYNERDVLNALTSLAGRNYTKADTQLYLQDLTTNTMWKEFVVKHWNTNNC